MSIDAKNAQDSGKDSAPRSKQIINEIVGKVEDYESRMSNFSNDYNEWSDLFTVKRPSRKSSINQFSNPRLTEMFRAVNALATLESRMLTAQDPFFELVPMDLAADNSALSDIESTLLTQLQITQYKRYLLKALVSKFIFGTVIVEEPYEVFGVNPWGQKMPASAFRPRSLLQVAFDRGCSDIDFADWLSTADIITKCRLGSIAKSDPNDSVWIKSEVEKAVSDGVAIGNPNSYVINRLSSAGYTANSDNIDARELIMYHGKFDCLNDGVEYVSGIVNRKYLVRFHANNFQHGRRNFRVARHVEYELEPLAYGLGKLLSAHHKSMDANRQKVQDSITFDTYSMWLKDRMAGINDNDFRISPMNIVETDNVNGLRRLESNVAGATLGLKLDEILRSEFRAASGATDTLQAILTDATATESSLAQNEALRAISVRAEIDAEPLVRQHLEVMHSSNIQYMDEPINVNVGGRVKRLYPSNLWYNVDFRCKVTTDKDYKPQRLKAMTEMLQILTSIRNEHPEKFEISVIPIVKEMARSIGIGVEDLIKPKMPQLMLPPQLSGMGGPAQLPDMSAQPGAMPIVSTPVGPTMVSQ